MKASERHEFILARKGQYEVKLMCKVLKINESGYYRWLRNRGKLKGRQLLLVKIQAIYDEAKENKNYGVERMQLALLQNGIEVSRRTIYRTMKENGLLQKNHTPHGITKATTEAQEEENLIKRDFKADAPLKKLLTDITETSFCSGKLYISPILDCFDGGVLALRMRTDMKKELCIDTVRDLKNLYPNLNGVILHSDRGSQYTSEAFREELKKNGMIQSLSGTGRCYDNARMESFFATLKKELLYKIPTHKMTLEEVKTAIFRYVFVYYNRIRVYTSNPMGLPPVKYREWVAKNQAA